MMSRCTCPVGYNCKHAAALARLFFQEYRQEFQQRYAESQSPQGIAKRQRGDDQAQRWLNDFKRYLQQTEPEQSVKTNNYLIYLLDQSVSLKKLTVDVQKARRNKNGSIAGESYYTQYENITRKYLTLPEQKRQLFNQIYYYAKINSDERFYQSNLDISSILLEHFKSFIQSGDVYWKKKSHTALQWRAIHHVMWIFNRTRWASYMVNIRQIFCTIFYRCLIFHLCSCQSLRN